MQEVHIAHILIRWLQSREGLKVQTNMVLWLLMWHPTFLDVRLAFILRQRNMELKPLNSIKVKTMLQKHAAGLAWYMGVFPLILCH